jgi:glutamine amidotransferase
MKLIGIVDYGLGNIQSIANALTFLGFKHIITSNAELLESSDGIILPGVGSFKVAMKNIKKKKLDFIIKDLIEGNKPCIATCLGMQLLFEKSLEFGESEGLGILRGEVKKLHNINIGWNKLEMNTKKNQILFNQKFFYFIHSFYVDSDTNYAHSYSFLDDFKFCSSINYKNTLATQFHLEKSGKSGLDIIQGFFNEHI